MIIEADPLHRVPLFAGIDPRDLERLAVQLRTIAMEEGRYLFRQGDHGDSMYVIQSGQVELYQQNATGERFVLEVCGPGAFFGEVALLVGGERAAHAAVREALSAWVLTKQDLEAFLEACPGAAMAMMASLAGRLQVSGGHLRQTVTRNAAVEFEQTTTAFDRVADKVAAFSGTFGFLALHLALYGGWIVLNLSLGRGAFDPFPFMLLAMVASTEAIFLSCFVLLSQNRQAAKDRIRSEIEYEVNVAAERQINQLHRALEDLRRDIRPR